MESGLALEKRLKPLSELLYKLIGEKEETEAENLRKRKDESKTANLIIPKPVLHPSTVPIPAQQPYV